ncbi:YppG family protein [Bacillus sp. AFS002410]|uniref:YppG family protein n=1 Tax=Bacillus sp. AFS002410 TaxID=2033481 RepID=UPI00211D4595|nr:YppG family protein [Bacillus sp. AFS002410]
MRQKMFPPNHSDNSFEWFRNQNQVVDEKFNYPEMNQYTNEIQRYYGNTIQPYSQNPTINTQLTPAAQAQTQMQATPMIEPLPYGGPSTQPGSSVQQGEYSAPQNFTMQQPTVQYNQGYQYDPNYYSIMQNQYPYMPMNPSQFGNQTNYYMHPQSQQYSMPPQNAQMNQQGPFATPAMFAPSTPYPTQPKKINQQNNGQSFQFSSILNQFKNNSGSYDVPKMMSTAGQMMNTMNQVGGLFKQIGVFFK